MASSAGRPRSTGSSRKKRTGANKSPVCRICCGSASTRFSGSTAFPTTPPSTKPSSWPNRTVLAPRPGLSTPSCAATCAHRTKRKKLLAELKRSQPALGWSHPEWLVARWQKRLGAEKTAQLLEWNNTPPKTFARVNTLKFRRGGFQDPPSPAAGTGSRGTPPSEFKDAGDLLTRWREENVEYDFVRRDWLEENLVFELKYASAAAFAGKFSRRLVLHSGSRHIAGREPNSARNPAKRFWIFAPRPAARRPSSRN